MFTDACHVHSKSRHVIGEPSSHTASLLMSTVMVIARSSPGAIGASAVPRRTSEPDDVAAATVPAGAAGTLSTSVVSWVVVASAVLSSGAVVVGAVSS